MTTQENNKTLLVIAPGTDTITDAKFHLLVADTGEVLASHICSHYGFAYNDLYGQCPERIEEFSNRFGEVEIAFINQIDLEEEELLRRNEEWWLNLQSENEDEN